MSDNPGFGGLLMPDWLMDSPMVKAIQEQKQREAERRAEARQNRHIGPIHHPTKHDYYEVMRPVWRREAFRQYIFDELMPGKRPGRFVRAS